MAIRRRSLSETPNEEAPKRVLGKSTFEKAGIPEDQIRLVALSKSYHLGNIPPKEMRVEDVLAMVRAPNRDDNVETFYRNRIKSPLTGIRAYCVLCSSGSPKMANLCGKTSCPLWPFRFGKNPFFGKLEKKTS